MISERVGGPECGLPRLFEVKIGFDADFNCVIKRNLWLISRCAPTHFCYKASFRAPRQAAVLCVELCLLEANIVWGLDLWKEIKVLLKSAWLSC